MSELIQLQSSLSRIFREALPVSTSLESLQSIKALQKINHELNGISPAPTSTSIAQVVEAYRRSQRVARFRDLKYVCHGAAMQMQDGWCVLGNEKLRDELLAEVERLDKYSQRLKCFEALLRSYFSFPFPCYDEQPPKTAHTGWKILRDWLAQQKTQFQRDGANKKTRLPGWFAVLTEHENLLTDRPCDRYGEDMLRGDNSSIEEARQGLGIPGESWVMQEAILSQMRVSVALGEDPFKARLDPLLRLAQGQTEVKVSDLLKRRAIALLISRYARCVSKPEQPVLRDAAVSIIGNPWLKRTEWDAWVKNSNDRPDDEARELVNGWLKRRLIADFFAVLSEDGHADQRRLNYWLRFEPVIEDLWLALGPDAMRNNSQPCRELRERAKGRLLRLENSGPSSNNAFIMKMGDLLVVEFGMTGNACYIYLATPAPFALEGTAISLYDLKNKDRGSSFIHKDGHALWESKFDDAICSKIGYKPGKNMPRPHLQAEQPRGGYTVSSSPSGVDVTNKGLSETEFWRLVRQYSLPTDDKRDKGGALWVNIEQSRYPTVDQWLEGLGFKYRPGRGWWKE